MIPGGSGFLGPPQTATDPGKLAEYLQYAHPWELDTLAKQGDPSIQQAVAAEQQRRAGGGRQLTQYDSMSPQDIAGYQRGNPSPGDKPRTPHPIPNYQIAGDAWSARKPPAPMYQQQPNPSQPGGMPQSPGLLRQMLPRILPHQQTPPAASPGAGMIAQAAPQGGILASAAPQASQGAGILASQAPALAQAAPAAASAAPALAGAGSWADMFPFLQWFS